MKCCDCPAHRYSQDMGGEYFDWCELGYDQIEYKNDDGMTYCKRKIETIKNNLRKRKV